VEVLLLDAVLATHTTHKNIPPALALAVPPIEATIVDTPIPCTIVTMVVNK
jgi:hypothetical protein